MNSQLRFTIDEEIGPRLRKARRTLGLNQTQMAELGGVSLNTQGKYEAPGGLPTIEYLLRIGAEGADWFWIITGRAMSDTLPPPEARLLDSFRRMPADVQTALTTIALRLQSAEPTSVAEPSEPSSEDPEQ